MRGERPTSGGGGADRDILVLRLTPEERRVLWRACRDYRNSIPSYLAAHQQEVRVLAALVRSLS
jgi:hypothetical protein